MGWRREDNRAGRWHVAGKWQAGGGAYLGVGGVEGSIRCDVQDQELRALLGATLRLAQQTGAISAAGAARHSAAAARIAAATASCAHAGGQCQGNAVNLLGK